MSEQQDARALMGMEIPDELANLFYGLTGTQWPKVDETRLRDFSDAYATVEYILATELPELVLVLRRKVQSTFDSQTTEYFENSLAQFTAGERNYIGEAAELAAEIREYAKDAANQVEYAKWMIIGQLIQLALEIAWAIATAKFTFGASLKFIPLFKFIKSQIIRRILNWLVWNLLSHLFIAQMFGVTMDLLIQRIQMDQGNRDEWDKELTRMAAAGAFVEGLLSAGLSFGADLFLSGQLAKLFGKNLPDPPAPPPPVRDIVTDPPAGPPGRGSGPETFVTPPPRDIPDPSASPPPRDAPDPTPPPREGPGDGPHVPPIRVPPPGGSITPEFNRDLVNLFARNSNEFLNAAQRPNTASVGMDHARRFVDGSSDVFARHFGDTIGDAAARNLGRDYADTLLRTWNTPRMNSSLDDVLLSAPLPQNTRDYLARDVPDAFGRTVTDFGSRWSDRATALGIGAASGAFEGYVGEGLTNLWFSPEQEWKASGMSAVAGAATSVVHDLAVTGGLKGLDSLSDLRDLNNRPAPDFDGTGPGPDRGSEGSDSDDSSGRASDSSSDWEAPPERGGNHSFESQDEPILRLRGGGGSVSSLGSYDADSYNGDGDGGNGDGVSTIAPSESEDGDNAERAGSERSVPRPDGTNESAGDGGRSGQPPAPAREHQVVSQDDTAVDDHTDGAGHSPTATVVEPPPAAQDNVRDRGAVNEEGFARESPENGLEQPAPRPSVAPGEDIDIGEFFRSLNGDVGETRAEGTLVPPPMVAAPVSTPPGTPASPPSSPPTSPAPGTSPTGRPESAGSGLSRDGVHDTEGTGVPDVTTHEDVVAPASPPEMAGGPPVTDIGDTSRDAELASDEVGVPRTESTPAPPEPVPAAPSAEPLSSDDGGPGGDNSGGEGSDPSVPPAGEELGPVPADGEELGPVPADGEELGPVPADGEELGAKDAASPSPGPENVPAVREDDAAQIDETHGEGPKESPATDPAEAALGEGDPVNPKQEGPAVEGEGDVVSRSPLPPSAESEGPARPDTPVMGTPPSVEPSPRRSGPEAETPRAPKPDSVRDPLRAPTDSEKGPDVLAESVPEEVPGTTAPTEGSALHTPPVTESEERTPEARKPEVEEPELKEAGPKDPEEPKAKEPEAREPKGKEPEAPERTPEPPAPPIKAPAPPVGTSRAEESANTHQLNYLINARWIESYGVRVDPDAVLDTFPGLPDDVRALMGNGLTTDPRDFFSPDGVRRTSSDGTTYTLRLSSDDAWRSGGQDRQGATTAKYKGLHDEQTQRSSGGSGLSGKARRPVVGFQANLFGVDAIPAPVVGARVSAFTGSAVQEQSGNTNHTQILTTEMTGVGNTYSSDLTATWQVEGGPPPARTTPEAIGGSGADTPGNPPPATVATEGPEGIELVSRPNPPPTTTTPEGVDGAGPSTLESPPPATTTTEGDGGTTRGPRPPLPTRIPQGVELVLMGGLRHRDDLPQRITFSDLWTPPTNNTGTGDGVGTGNTAANNTGTNNTGTNNTVTETGGNTTGRTDTDTGTRENRRHGGYLANSHPIAIDSITRRTAETRDTAGDTKPTTMNSWIADRLGFEPPATGSNTRRVLHRTHGDSEAPAVVSQPKSGSRAQHRELNRRGVLEVFSDDIVMTQLPTMTSEPRTLSVPDAKGGSRTITLWSQPVSMELVPDTPNNFNIKLTDRLSRGSGQLANRLKGFFAAVSGGIVSRVPGDVIRVEAPSFEARFQKVWSRGRGRSDNAWDSHLFHSTDTAVYNTRRTIAVWIDNDTSPTLFDVSATEALTADDVRRLAEGRPTANRITHTGDPFLDRAQGPTHLGDALVRDVTHADGSELRTPDGGPARTFFRDYAHQLLTEIDRQYPGLVLPHLALPGTPEPDRSHAGWRHRRNKSQARENTEILLSKVNAASFRADRDAWLSGQVEIKLVETKVLPWLNEFKERRLGVHDHISVWPRVRITGYSEAAPLASSHTGTTTGSSSSLNRQAGKITSTTAEGRFGVTVRNADKGIDAFGNTSEAGGGTGRATSDFRKRQRTEHGMSSTTETNVKDKSGSRRLFADARFSAWFGPKDGLVPRSSRAEALSSTGMGREIFSDGPAGVPPPRAQVELHTPRVGERVLLDTPPAGNPEAPRKLPSSEASRLFGRGPADFVTTSPQSTQLLRPSPSGLETITEAPEPSAPRTGHGHPPGTPGVNPPPTTTVTPPPGTTTNPPQPPAGNPTRATTDPPPSATTSDAPPRTTTSDAPPRTTTSDAPPRTTTGDDTTGRAPRTTDAGAPPLAIQRTPRAEQLSRTFNTVQAFNPAVFRRGDHVITVGSLTYGALDQNHWSFSRSTESREGSSDIIAAHTSPQTLAASPGLTQNTGDRFRVQLKDGLAPQRTRPTTVTWYVPTHVVSAALREFAVMEPNQVREISFSSGLSRETTLTISVAARGAFNPQPTADTPSQAPRGTVGPLVQPGLDARYMPYGHGQGESSSVSYRTRREVKFTGATFEFVTNGVILQSTEHKKDFDFLFSVPRSAKESSYTAWHAPVRDAQKMMVPALWVFSNGLVNDRLIWRRNGDIELGSQPPPHAPPPGLDTKPDLAGKGFDSGPSRVPSLVDDLMRQIGRDGWELTVYSREDLIKDVSDHVKGNRSGLEILVKPTKTHLSPHGPGVRIKNNSRTATLTFDVRRGPGDVRQLGGQMEYVDRNVKSTGQNQVNSKLRGYGTGGAIDLLAPIGNREDPGSGRQVGAVNAGGTPAFRQQSITEQSSAQGKEREETQERVLYSPYAVVTTPTHVTARLEIGDRTYTAEADDNQQESVHPLPYLEAATTEGSPRPEPQYEPSSISLDRSSSYVESWVAGRKGPNGTGYQDGDGGLDAIPLAIEGEAKQLLDAAVVNTALVNGWAPPNGRPALDAASVTSATRYLDGRTSDIDRAAGITARKDELLLLALTPDATRGPTVLGEFKDSVVKVRALLNTGAATIEGVSNDSRARDSDQEGGRQSQGTAEQKASNLGVGGQVTETARPQDRVREAGEAENVALSGARSGNSAGQRHGAVASGPGTKQMFLVRVPTVWAVWAESADSKVPVHGGQVDASVLRWVDADQARSWGLDTDTPAIERYAKAEAAFTKADAAYFKVRRELFSLVGQVNDPGTNGTSFRQRFEDLEDVYRKEEGTRDNAMRDLVKALRDLRAPRPQAAPATGSEGAPPPDGKSTLKAPESALQDDFFVYDRFVGSEQAGLSTDPPPLMTPALGLTDEGTGSEGLTGGQLPPRVTATNLDDVDDVDLYDATPPGSPRPEPALPPGLSLTESALPESTGAEERGTLEVPPPPRETRAPTADTALSAPFARSGGPAPEPTLTDPPSHGLGRRDSTGILRFPSGADLHAYGDLLQNPDHNPNAYDTLPARTRRYIDAYTAESWIAEFSRLQPLNETTVQAELDRRRQESQASPGWQIYEINGGRWPALETLPQLQNNPELTPEQRKVIQGVLDSRYPDIALDNLRDHAGSAGLIAETLPDPRGNGGYPNAQDVLDVIHHLERATTQPLPEAVEAVRGVYGFEHLASGSTANPESLIGNTYTDPGFMSVSLGNTPGAAGGSPTDLIRFTLPQGTQGLWVGERSLHPNEREIILARGTTYQIVSVQPWGRGYALNVLVIPPGHTPPPNQTAPTSTPADEEAVTVDEGRSRQEEMNAVYADALNHPPGA